MMYRITGLVSGLGLNIMVLTNFANKYGWAIIEV